MTEEKTVENDLGQQDRKTSMLPIVTIILLLMIMASTATGTYFTLTRCSSSETVMTPAADEVEVEEDEVEESETSTKEAYYFSLDPAFIVNFSGKDEGGFLQVNIDGLTRDSSIKEEVTKHLPQIRSSIVLLLSRQKYSDLVLPEGKENLRKEILTSIQDILKNETGNKGIEDVYFTNFVMQ